MIKAFSAIAAAGFIAAALTVLPGFAPQVEASVPQALAKGDRLDIRTVGKDCSQDVQPSSSSGTSSKETRSPAKYSLNLSINFSAIAPAALTIRARSGATVDRTP